MPRRFAWWASTPSGLLWLFVAGAAIRLWLATRPGFSVDMGSFRGWAVQLDDVGPRAFYPPEAYGEGTPGVPPSRFIDYPPGYLYVLWGLGAISRRLFGVGPPDVLLKLPPILGDLALAWVVVQLAARLTPAAYRRVPWRGTAAAAVLLNPALIVVSALWGQVDVFQALLILGAFLLLGTGAATFQREAGGLALLVLAVLTKPQALFVVPVAVLVLVWRHARAAAADPAPGRLALALARIAALGVTSAAFALLVIWPFLGPNPVRLLRFYQHASSTYPHTSVWAFNLWGALGFWKPDSGPEAFPSPAVPAVAIGWTLFAVGAAFVGWRAWRSLGRGEAEGRVLLAGALSLTLVAFAVLTRIHERYLFVVIAGLAAFAAYRGLRWALAGLSLLYLVNVWLPYGYYTFFHHQTAREDPPAWYRRVFTLVFGDPEVTDTPQRATLSLVGGLACLFVAWRVWTWLEARSGAEEAVSAPEPPVWARSAAPVREQAPPPWTLTLHPVGLRGAAIALLVFVVALATKVVGLGHPAGMYFDEVYHARTAGEYLEGQPVYEWTHPPLAKLGMAASIRGLSRFRTTVAPDAPAVRGPMAAGEDRMYAVHDRRPATVVPLAFDDGCSVRADGRAIGPVAGPVTALAASGDRLFVGADDGAGGTLHRFDRGRAVWTVPLPAPPVDIAYVRNAAFVVTNERDLLHVDRDGEVQPLDFGAHSVAAGPDEVWVSFPERGELQSFAPEGVRQRTAELSIDPGEVIAAERGDRVLVADEAGTRIQSVNPQTARLADRADLDRGADMFAVVDRAGLPWAADGVRLNLIEPRGLAVLGGVELPGFPTALAPVPGQRSVAAVVPGTGIVCATASPEFAWRFGSAVTGSLMVALVFLLAVRLFGSVRAGLLAAVFLTVCGLAFTMSRLAMNDSYVTAGILGAWFCVLGMLYRWGSDEERSRPAALAWLAGAGVLMGAAVASKWPAMFALGGIGLLLIWDLASRRREGVWSLAGPLPVSLAVLGVALLLVPAGIYLASYIPELRMGRTLPGLLQLQRDMFGYHSRLTESHPFGSPWYGWPFGHRAVYLFLGDEGGGRRAEMWTAANPVVFIGGLLALIALAGSAFRRRAVGAAVVVGAALVQYLPWVGVDRVVFLYHYLPVIPFLALALGWWLTDGPAGRPRRTETILAVGGALLSFLLLLPVLTGITLPNAAVDAVKAWLPWVF